MKFLNYVTPVIWRFKVTYSFQFFKYVILYFNFQPKATKRVISRLNQDKNLLDPLQIPLLIIGSKYDKYQVCILMLIKTQFFFQGPLLLYFASK